MTALTRRSVLAGATALSATALAPTISPPARAAAPLTGKQAPAFYRYKVGTYEITAVSDGVRRGKLETSPVRNAKLEEVQAALEASFMPKDQSTVFFNQTLVNTGSKLVLIDTGNGQGRDPTTGMMAANLAAAGVDPKSIDLVVISHFHGDHIGGLRTADGQLAFPNAEIKVPAVEWAHWMDDAKMNAAPEAARGGFQNVRRIFSSIADKVTKYEWGKEVAPGITAIDTSGHTPGHTSHVVASGSDRVLIQADVTANMALLIVRNPGWHMGGDMDGAKAEQTRRKLYDMAAAEKMLVQSYHFPFPACGYIEKDGNGYRYIPAPWNPVI